MDNIRTLVKSYYQAILNQDLEQFMSLLSENVVHAINQGATEIGKSKFKLFMQEQFSHGDVEIENLQILSSEDAQTAMVHYICKGRYLKDIPGFPPAKDQAWSLPVMTYFEVKNNFLSHVAVYYNLQDWIRQVS